MVALPQERQERYLRGITIVWGEVVAADCRGALHGKGVADEEKGKAAAEAWQETNARLLREQHERRWPLNFGSRMLAKDPAVLAEEKEGRTCRGCIYEYKLTIVGDIEHACSLNRYHGARCREYVARSTRA